MVSMLFQQLQNQPSQEIHSLSDFITRISELPHDKQGEPEKLQLLFRGHSSINYELRPSIGRYKNSIKLEVGLVEQACNRLPKVFNKSQSKLEVLSKLQHYGIPTRLLDFTRNPLVALYFACQKSQDKTDNTGQVLIMQSHICYSWRRGIDNWNLLYESKWDPKKSLDEANTLRNILWKYYDYEFIKGLIVACIDSVPDEGIEVHSFIEKIREERWFKDWALSHEFDRMSSSGKEICIAALLKLPLVIEEQELVERQRLQQGVYILVPNKIEKTRKGHYYIKKELPELFHHEGRMGHCYIKEEKKESILRDLDKVGINEGFLFADSIDHVCAQIKKDNFTT